MIRGWSLFMGDLWTCIANLSLLTLCNPILTPPDFYALIFSIPPLIPMHWNLFLFDYYVMRLYPSLIIMYWNFVPLDQKIKYSNNIIILCIYAYKAYIILTFLHSNVVPLLTLYAQILLPPLTLCTQFCPPLDFVHSNVVLPQLGALEFCPS